jgi:hypothetical protein
MMETWLDILYEAIGATLENNGELFILRDEAGYLTLRNAEDLKLKLVLGDESLCYDYGHETSIDQNFYNAILIHAIDGKSSDLVYKVDDKSVKKYGYMQYYEKLNANSAQASVKADKIAKLYGSPYETMTLDCLGDMSVRAGTSVWVSIAKTKVDKRLIVKSVTHNFLPHHTMSVELFI